MHAAAAAGVSKQKKCEEKKYVLRRCTAQSTRTARSQVLLVLLEAFEVTRSSQVQQYFQVCSSTAVGLEPTGQNCPADDAICEGAYVLPTPPVRH